MVGMWVVQTNWDPQWSCWSYEGEVVTGPPGEEILGRNNNGAVEEGGDVRERSDNTGVEIEKDSPCPLHPSLHGALLGFNLLGD